MVTARGNISPLKDWRKEPHAKQGKTKNLDNVKEIETTPRLQGAIDSMSMRRVIGFKLFGKFRIFWKGPELITDKSKTWMK